MGTPHKHAAFIKAWADGEEVQFKYCGKWKLLESTRPCWHADDLYRIKPKTIKYRVALIKGKDYCHTATVNAEEDINYVEALDDFCYWLTDWVEVEVYD